MTDTIKPSNAISIWASSDFLYAECPSPDGRKSHLLKLELTPDGFKVLINMLKARTAKSKIGEKGDLTKHQVKQELKKLVLNSKVPVKKEHVIVADSQLSASLRDILRKAGY